MQSDLMLFCLRISGKQLRLARRRAEQTTSAFREEYRIRSGIEGTNSGLKRVTGLGRLRVRGRPAVFTAMLLKIAGWNILQAARVRSLLEKLGWQGNTARFRQFRNQRIHLTRPLLGLVSHFAPSKRAATKLLAAAA